LNLQPTALPDSRSTEVQPTPTAGPSPTPLPTTTADQATEDQAIYDALVNTPRPNMDRVELAEALKGVKASDIPQPPTSPTKTYNVGDHQVFWIHFQDQNTFKNLDFTLMYKSKHAYLFGQSNAQMSNANGDQASAQDWKAA